jgi:hypothetical protein
MRTRPDVMEALQTLEREITAMRAARGEALFAAALVRTAAETLAAGLHDPDPRGAIRTALAHLHDALGPSMQPIAGAKAQSARVAHPTLTNQRRPK